MCSNKFQLNIFYLTIWSLCCVSRVKNRGIVYRETWIQNKSFCENEYIKLSRPIKHVVVLDIPATRHTSCFNYSECGILLQEIYEQHTNIWGDIGYNFLIGGDGMIYEGRGWYRQGFAVEGFNHMCISVGYIGNFTENGTGKLKIYKSLQSLLNMGTEFRFLPSDFKLLTHSQIMRENKKLKRIGKNPFDSQIYKLVTTLPSWFNGTVEIVYVWITNKFQLPY